MSKPVRNLFRFSRTRVRTIECWTICLLALDLPGASGRDEDAVCCEPPAAPTSPAPVDGAEDAPLDTVLLWNDLGDSTARAVPKAIYGNDDRLDEYQVIESAIRELGDSTAVLLPASDLTDNGDGTVTLPSSPVTDFFDLCPDEPFSDQPAPGVCSGFLVSPSTIATAGHCVPNARECEATSIVFGFVMSDAATPVLTVDASEVYYCTRIDARQGVDYDWALVQLDRPVTGHAPLAFRSQGRVSDGEPLIVIGHPLGLPRKYAAGAHVRRNPDGPTFEANLDAYGGNSGSAVFSARTLLVEGMLIRGVEDFAYRPPPDDCLVSNRYPDDGRAGEAVVRATEFGAAIPRVEYDVYLGLCPDTVFQGTTSTSRWEPAELAAQTSYCWRIVARNAFGETSGPQWQFTTIAPAQLAYEPSRLEFGDDETSVTFDLWNSGGGLLEIDIAPRNSWISVNPARGSSTGPSDRTTVTVTVDRTNLEPNVFYGAVEMRDSILEITLTVRGGAPPTPLCGAAGLLGLVTPVLVAAYASRRKRSMLSRFS